MPPNSMVWSNPPHKRRIRGQWKTKNQIKPNEKYPQHILYQPLSEQVYLKNYVQVEAISLYRFKIETSIPTALHRLVENNLIWIQSMAKIYCIRYTSYILGNKML